jgi:hypothetical protein
METVRQIVNDDGLQIPLPLVERYGFQSGTRVTLELDEHGIRIVPAFPDQQEVENIALQYLLANLGDAVQIQVEQQDDEWQVAVLADGVTEPLGSLVYSIAGKLNSEKSTAPNVLREAAVTAYNK